MFEDTLLESSPSAAPVLKAWHWLFSIGIGVIVFIAGYYVLPSLSFGVEERVIVAQSAIIGIHYGLLALILCYVVADAGRYGFNRGVWFTVTLVLGLVGVFAGFIIYLVYTASKTANWKRATLPIAYILEGIVIGMIVLYPLIYTEALPKAQLMTFLAAPPPPPPPPPPPAAAPPPRVIRRITAEDMMRAPTVIPKTIVHVENEPAPEAVGVVGGVPGGVPGGTMGGVMGGVLGSVLSQAAPPPPPPKAVAPKRIRVGGQVESAKLIFQPKPEYPPLARMARIQGQVRLEAVISKDGTIQDLKVLNGHPLLVKAALEAVQRWRYQPTLLNGEPVEVVTEIDVNFTLAE